jgi:hypothetical protein
MDPDCEARVKRGLLNAKRSEVEYAFVSFITMAERLDRSNDIEAATVMLNLAAACGPALEVQSEQASAQTYATRDSGLKQFSEFNGQRGKMAPMFGAHPPKGTIPLSALSGPIPVRRRG